MIEAGASRHLESGLKPREMSMKMMIALSMLLVAACAAPSGSLRTSSDSFAGSWRGEIVKGEVRRPAEFRFSGGDGGYQGIFWSHGVTPLALSGLQLGPEVHFEIPELGTFDGTANGEVMTGKFHDGAGEGSFALEKYIDWDDPRNAP
jgi:hypothetical protein